MVVVAVVVVVVVAVVKNVGSFSVSLGWLWRPYIYKIQTCLKQIILRTHLIKFKILTLIYWEQRKNTFVKALSVQRMVSSKTLQGSFGISGDFVSEHSLELSFHTVWLPCEYPELQLLSLKRLFWRHTLFVPHWESGKNEGSPAADGVHIVLLPILLQGLKKKKGPHGFIQSWNLFWTPLVFQTLW